MQIKIYLDILGLCTVKAGRVHFALRLTKYAAHWSQGSLWKINSFIKRLFIPIFPGPFFFDKSSSN
jgi:hypothetical protein